jgi:hypothetical protein
MGVNALGLVAVIALIVDQCGTQIVGERDCD